MPILDVTITDEHGVLTYGATVDDVKPWLPHRRWTPGTKPDLDDVAKFIESQASVLEVDVAALVTVPYPFAITQLQADRLVSLARRAVVIGAAAQTDAAGNPERARPNDASSYSSWLLARYQEAIDKLAEYTAGLEAGQDPVGVDVESEPAWSFPDPVGWALRGI